MRCRKQFIVTTVNEKKKILPILGALIYGLGCNNNAVMQALRAVKKKMFLFCNEMEISIFSRLSLMSSM